MSVEPFTHSVWSGINGGVCNEFHITAQPGPIIPIIPNHSMLQVYTPTLWAISG